LRKGTKREERFLSSVIGKGVFVVTNPALSRKEGEGKRESVLLIHFCTGGGSRLFV